jgi:flagellar biosynthesis component FlhA
MKTKLIKLLNWLNLLDYSGKLSITNCAVVLLLVKIAYAPTLDWAVVSGLLVTLLSYSHKRYENNKVQAAKPNKDLEEVSKKIEEVASKANMAMDQASKVAISLGFKGIKKDE